MDKREPWLGSPAATADVIKKHGFSFRKSYGQNFLVDLNIIHKIVEAADIRPGDFVLEIGPGIGTLTQQLAFRAKSVTAVEIDSRLIPVLEETLAGYDNVNIINADILKLDAAALINNTGNAVAKAVANLPYYVTTPVLMNLLENCGALSSITIMVQKEVAERIAASPGTKSYGALTLAAGYYSTVKKITDVSPNCFIPRPDVTSSVIRLDIKKERSCPCGEELLFKTIKAAFAQRRKTLANALNNSGAFAISKEGWAEVFEEAQIAPGVRGETLSLERFITLASAIEGHIQDTQ